MAMFGGIVLAVGMTGLLMDMRFQRQKMIAGIPDTFGKSDAEIKEMPPFVQYFKCNDQVESGDPGCNDFKFNLTYCPNRAGRNSWHPGWRYQAMMGHTMAFTLLEVIAESLQNLIALEPAEPETPQEKHARFLAHLQKLDAEEQEDYDNIFRSPLPDEFNHWFDDGLCRGDKKDANKVAIQDIVKYEKLVKDAAFCHTGLLPAEIRYKGLLTENFEKIGNIMDEGYDVGTWRSNISDVERSPPEGKVATAYIDTQHPGHEDQLILIRADDEYEECEDVTNKDHKDNFYISNLQGWRKILIPNNSEKEYYKEYSADKGNGWFMICLAPCEY
jgi:hypothetical protein